MRELYQQTFSQVHSSTVIRWEDMEAMKPKKRISRNLIVLAAVIALLAVRSTVAVAADWFGLRSLLLPQKTPVSVLDDDGIVIPGEVKEVDAISLSGYEDSAESRATAEWQAFLDGYDVDGAARAADKNPEALDERYSLYQVYNQEMADKLDEIVEKYGLMLHSRLEIVLPGSWSGAVGNFVLPGNTVYSGYIYEDGTFSYDGDASLPDYDLVDYQFRRSVKGTFNEVILNIEDVSQYREWVYETACGVPVTLALGPDKGLILMDLGDSIVTVNVLAGTETDPDDIFSSGPISAGDLEDLADSFDFTVLTPAKSPDLDAVAAASAPETTEDIIYTAAGVRENVAQEFYAEFVQAIEEGRREDVAARIAWPRTVTAPAGTFTIQTAEDFLPYYDDIFTAGLLDAVRANQYDSERADLFASDGMVGGAGGAVWFGLVEAAGVRSLQVLTVQNPEGCSLRSGGSAGVRTDALYDRTAIETAVAEEFVENLMQLLRDGDRKGVAELFVYPCQVQTAAGTFTVDGPEELAACYDDVIATETDFRTLLGELEKRELFGQNGMVGAGSGVVWFGLMQDGDIRLMALQTASGWSIRQLNSGVMAEYLPEEAAEDPLFVQTGMETAVAEEFLPYYDKTVNFDAKTLAANLGTEELFSADGLAAAAGGEVWFGLKEDGDIRLFTV